MVGTYIRQSAALLKVIAEGDEIADDSSTISELTNVLSQYETITTLIDYDVVDYFADDDDIRGFNDLEITKAVQEPREANYGKRLNALKSAFKSAKTIKDSQLSSVRKYRFYCNSQIAAHDFETKDLWAVEPSSYNIVEGQRGFCIPDIVEIYNRDRVLLK